LEKRKERGGEKEKGRMGERKSVSVRAGARKKIESVRPSSLGLILTLDLFLYPERTKVATG
jgi:hypothetical protein